MAPMLGWLPDRPKAPGEPPDHDALPLLAAVAVPPAFSNRRLVADVLNQGQLGSCVANAVMQAVRASHVKQGVMAAQLGSRLYGYWCSRAFEHATARDGGTYLRDFFRGLNKFGFCPESKWPYDVSRFADMPPAAAFRAAFDQHSPTSYKAITTGSYQRLPVIKAAVAAGYLVCFGTLVSEAFVREPLPSAPLPPPEGLPIAGGHAMCVVGYDGDTFDVVNSWGPYWGEVGYCRFSGDYMAWGQTQDLWIVATAPEYSE
jgi:C1A family cysteine protease